MDKVFLSEKNINRLNAIITNQIYQNTHIKLQNKHYKIIIKIMKYFCYNNNLPNNLSLKEKLMQLNKLTINTCIQKIQSKLKENPIQVSMRNPNDNYNSHIGGIINPESTLDHVDNENVGRRFEELEKQRRIEYQSVESNINKQMKYLQPKKIIDEEEGEENSETKYNQMLQNRNYGSNEPENLVKDINNMELNQINDVNNAFKNNMLIKQPETDYILKDYYILVDSMDRDFGVFEYPNKFQVKFSPTSDIIQDYVFSDNFGTTLYSQRKRIRGDGHGASISSRLKNIYSIECLETIVPHSSKYICGTCPYEFNGPRIDRNKAVSNQFTSYPYGPFYNDNIGMSTSVLDEPYLLLTIDELDDNDIYYGTNKTLKNSFAKLRYDTQNGGILSSFIHMRTVGKEKKIFDPPLASLDKMTLNIRKSTGDHYDFGTDKIYVKRFDPVSGENCRTKITIIEPIIDCECSHKDIGHCLLPGNVIFFYDKMNCTKEKIKFSNYLTATIDEPIDAEVEESETDYFIISSQIEKNGLSYYVNFQAFMELGDYIVINNETLKVIEFLIPETNVYKIKVSKPVSTTLNVGDIITDFGFYKQDKKGISVTDINKINTRKGLRVCHDESNESLTTFVIDFPYNNIDERLQEKDLTLSDNTSEIFFIKKKLQISYTFKITVKEQNYKKLRPIIN